MAGEDGKSVGGRLRIAILDSGVNPRHRQVGPVADGVRIRLSEGRAGLMEAGAAAWADEIGHGTAVAAAVSEGLPPDRYALLSVRVFGRRLDAPAECLAAGIRWAAENGAQLANLSAGVPAGSDPEGEQLLRTAAVEAGEAGSTLIAPRRSQGVLLIPGALLRVRGLIGVEADAHLERGRFARRGRVLLAAPWARPLPPLPRERNYFGVSFAVAAVTNRAARLLLSEQISEQSGRQASPAPVEAELLRRRIVLPQRDEAGARSGPAPT